MTSRSFELADLVYFEQRCLQTVGRRQAILDDLKAKIAEARAQQIPPAQSRSKASPLASGATALIASGKTC